MGFQIQSMDVDKVCESVAELARCLDGGVDCAAEKVSLKSAIRAAMEIMPFGDAYAILSRAVDSQASGTGGK
jgi:hypothetical protein